MSAQTRASIQAHIDKRLEQAPRRPGVYLMRDSQGEVIYVGKAKELVNRVRSYFRATSDGRFQIDAMIERVADIEFLVTENEKDALLLENNLIKQIGPRYNIRLRDDKSYVILKLNVQHPWPRALVTRGFKNDGALYFGPFSSADQLRRSMKILTRTFPLRLCSDHTVANRTRACVYHDIHICSAPCVGQVSSADYRGYVDGLIQFLKGQDRQLLDDLHTRMTSAANARQYEQAARLRDQIEAITRTVEPQQTEETGATYDRDVFGYHWDGEHLALKVLFFRDGKLVNSGTHRFRALLPVSELLSSYLVQFYDGNAFIPPEILLPVAIEDQASLEQWLTDRAERKVKVRHPSRGRRRRQVDMAGSNAEQALREHRTADQQQVELLEVLREKLGLSNRPEVIECYDISHLGGGETVGSQVTFNGGVADKTRYRRYRIRTTARGDDYAALEEVLTRRLRRGLDETDLPDLIVIDGGKGQLERVVQVMQQLNIVDIDVIGLAKQRRRQHQGRTVVTDERIFRPGDGDPLVLKQDSPENYLLVRIRDEAHRFAINYHRQLRRRRTLESSLEKMPGIGPKRRQLLLRHFRSPQRVAAASLEELMQVPGIGAKGAAQIIAFLKHSPFPGPGDRSDKS